MSHFYENRQSTYQDDDMGGRESYMEDGEMMEQSMPQGSQYGHSAFPTSPRSWVDYPAPMAESMSHAPSNATSLLRGPRPIPEPLSRRQNYPTDPNMDDEFEDEVEEDDYIDNNEPPIMHSVYQGQDYGMHPQSRYHEAPQPVPSPTLIPITPLRPQRTFVGGFFKGLRKVFRGGKDKDKTLRRKGTFGTEGTSTSMTHITTGDTLPRYLSNPSIGPSNPQFARRLTMAVNNGSLPPDTTPMAFESRSPPHHHDPSHPLPFQFRPETTNDLQLRPQAVTPQFPSVFITPATDSYAEGERAEVENADQYNPPPPEDAPPQNYSDDEDDEDEHPRPLDMTQDRTTMMMYNNTDPSHPSQHGHTPSQGHPGSSSHPTSNSHPYSNAPSQSQHHSVAPSQSHHYSNAPSQTQPYSNAPSQSQPYSNAPSQSQHYSHAPSQYPQYSSAPSRMPSTRRVSYPSELPTRATMEAMQGRQMPPPVPPLPETSMSMVPTSPRRRTIFSRRPTTATTGTSVLSPKSGTTMTQTMTSTSGYTVSTAATSCYDPSFASDLNPVEKFFKGLYNLPWIAPERVTVDYRPADSPRAKAKVKSGAKKPMPSWYRTLVTRSRVGTIDAVSNPDPTMSMGETMSPNTSRRRSREHRSHRHHSPTSKPSRRHRRHRRRTMTTMTTDTGMTSTTAEGHRRAASPLVPGTYPYAFPSYPYPYPYPPYPTMSPPPPHESGSRSASPRGTRKHKSSRDKYAAYQQAAYQPMAIPGGPSPPPMPAQMYYISPSPPGSNHGADPRTGMPMQVSPVVVHYVPAAFNPSPHAMRSPGQQTS
ncbi:hypothetical protein CVT24_000316 [Panaeolus cyanescens]|uniref:Uncharacterized protein n=1 Tax=Panaeolus cyanescens TaxID=181874 RepID=A0A409YCY9_9AGAR|nr:hypothetical protein CVT24_000316 [Panaeolus cyanescens]